MSKKEKNFTLEAVIGSGQSEILFEDNDGEEVPEAYEILTSNFDYENNSSKITAMFQSLPTAITCGDESLDYLDDIDERENDAYKYVYIRFSSVQQFQNMVDALKRIKP